MNVQLRASFLAPIFILLASPTFGFNELGHSVIAKVAHDKLSPAQRTAIHNILKEHPHYCEYLIAFKPAGVSEEEWSFIRSPHGPIGFARTTVPSTTCPNGITLITLTEWASRLEYCLTR